MTYFACQLKEQGGYRMSTLKIIPEENIHILNPLQWRKTDIKQNEFEGINALWLNRCKPQSNWTIEKWIISLNKCIKDYRERHSTKKQTTNKSQLRKEIDVITPIKPVQSIEPIPSKVIKPIQPINPVPSKSIEDNLKFRNGIVYEEITDETDPLKQISNTIKYDIKEFISKRLIELQTEHGITFECLVDFNLELYFE